MPRTELHLRVSTDRQTASGGWLPQVGSTDCDAPRLPRPLLSVREAARLLGVHPATVYKLCADRQLPHARVLNAIRIVPADLARFVQERRRG